MNPPPLPVSSRTAPLLTVGAAMLVGSSILVLWAVIGITGYFRLSSEASALRQSAMESLGGTWDKKIALHSGLFTTALIRTASHYVKLDAEPRAALEAIRGMEVGIYKLQTRAESIDGGAFLSRADKAMSKQGWQRIIAVNKTDQFVAAYCPKRSFSSSNLKCCVAVFDGRDLVVASFHGNAEPLLELGRNHMDLNRAGRLFAVR